jgi:hypothetical protein
MELKIATKKMNNALTQLQRERVMWQVLSQEAEVRHDCANEKSRRVVKNQIENALKKEQDLKSHVQDLHEYYSELIATEKRKTRSAKKASRHWQRRAEIRKVKIAELEQSKIELADKLSDLAKETADIQSKLIMTEALVSVTSMLELKRVGRAGKW